MCIIRPLPNGIKQRSLQSIIINFQRSYISPRNLHRHKAVNRQFFSLSLSTFFFREQRRSKRSSGKQVRCLQPTHFKQRGIRLLVADGELKEVYVHVITRSSRDTSRSVRILRATSFPVPRMYTSRAALRKCSSLLVSRTGLHACAADVTLFRPGREDGDGMTGFAKSKTWNQNGQTKLPEPINKVFNKLIRRGW